MFIISGCWRSPFCMMISISIVSCPSITQTEPSSSPLSHSYSASPTKQMHLRSTPLSQGLLASSMSGKLWYGIVLHLNVSLYLLLSYKFKLISDLSVVTIGCFYFEGSDHETYKFVFNQLQEAVEITTGLPMRFKQLTPGGNLLAMNTDMKAAQVLGAGDSFMKTNVPSHSGVNTTDSAELVKLPTKMCSTHLHRYFS